MAEKGLHSPVFRRIFTTVLLLGIAGTFVGMYYLVYLPQQQAAFNQRMFRILREIATNFSTRAENYGKVSSNSYINRTYPDSAISFNKLFSSRFDTLFQENFKGDPVHSNKINSFPHFEHDSISYKIFEDDFKKDISKPVDSSQKALSEILEPLISIHANTFESILLVKLSSDSEKKKSGDGKTYDAILYKSSPSDIANIKTDSLFRNRGLQAAALDEINLEGIGYKMFLVPFQMKVAPNETFVLTGIISKSNYNKLSQNIPLDFLVVVVFVLVFLLLCLPFLKVFVLSVEENITITDVRFIIASIFIIPFVITLFSSAVWLYIYPDKFTNNILSSLQNEIKDNFYKEIRLCINQAKAYDSVISHPTNKILRSYLPEFTSINDDPAKGKLQEKIKGVDKLDLKDVLFYPEYYKNVDVVHWIDTIGNDIAAWRFTKDTATYFNLKDRQYFKDIKYKIGYVYPNSKDTFTIQATLSKLTGEYTINTVIPSNVQISPGKKSIATGISSRMYSVHNTVVPAGYAYCLIDQKGEIIFHSDTARSLQENLLAETGNNSNLQNAISHKDSTYIDDILLYDEPVKMIVKPLEDLPYYLVTYYKKRGEYLFIFHIAAFVFLCMSILHLFVSLFSYCIMMTNRRITKLLFIPGVFKWLKPSSDKKDYYIRNCIQLIACVVLVQLFSVFLNPGQYHLYMLNYALLLPLFAVTGYYIIKRAKDFIEPHNNGEHKLLLMDKKQVIPFLYEIKNILLLYIVSFLIFATLQDVLVYNELYSPASAVKLRIWSLIILIPFVLCTIASVNIDYVRNAINKVFRRVIPINEEKISPTHYLTSYIISLILSVIVISVIPAITLTSYALNEERKLHFQTFEIELAKKIQERRTRVNPKFWQTKLNILPDTAQDFVNSLKFDHEKGLYLGGLSLDTSKAFEDSLAFYSENKLAKGSTQLPENSSETFMVNCSPFYKLLTQFLFLPPDHDEFYENWSHSKFYYWKESWYKKKGYPQQNGEADSLNLYYKNLTDHRNTVSFNLRGKLPYFYLFKDITKNPLTLLILLVILIFVFLFYKIIYSVAKRIFMIGYFENDKMMGDESFLNGQKDTDWLKERYGHIDWNELHKTSCFKVVPRSFAEVRNTEKQLLEEGDDECILKIHLALTPVFESIWEDCTDVEKFTLYDFALDGFTNYKKVIILFQLYQKGLLIKEEDNFTLMTRSFRNFLLTKEKSEVIETLSKQSRGSWSTMRTVFYIILLVVAVFIFLSQEEASKRLITIVTSLGALLPAILKLFDKSTFSTGTTKSSQ